MFIEINENCRVNTYNECDMKLYITSTRNHVCVCVCEEKGREKAIYKGLEWGKLTFLRNNFFFVILFRFILIVIISVCVSLMLTSTLVTHNFIHRLLRKK